MVNKTNKQQNNVEKYVQLEKVNENNLEVCFEYLCKYANLEDIDLSEVRAVVDFSYEKDNKDIQIQTLCEYLGVDNAKAKFWIKNTVKYNGLSNWCSWMQKKFVSEGE